MIKCHINKKLNLVSVKTNGTGQEILTELLGEIKIIHDGINEKLGEQAADAFKISLLGSLLDPESPVWKNQSKLSDLG